MAISLIDITTVNALDLVLIIMVINPKYPLQVERVIQDNLDY